MERRSMLSGRRDPMSGLRERMEFLAMVEIFSSLDEGYLEEIATRMMDVSFPSGELIFREGDEGKAFFIVESGVVQIFLDGPAGVEVITHLKRGDVFGEMALFTGNPRSASARSIGDVSLLALAREDFLALCRLQPDIPIGLLAVLSRRLAEANASRGSFMRGAKVVSVTSPSSADAGHRFAMSLAHALVDVSERRVALFDPELRDSPFWRLLGDPEDALLDASAFSSVAGGALEMENSLWKTPGGAFIYRRPDRGGIPLLRHEEALSSVFHRLRDCMDFVVVCSSSTMASLNASIMRLASRLFVVVPGDSTGGAAPFELMERLYESFLSSIGIGRERCNLILPAAGRPGESDAPGADGWGGVWAMDRCREVALSVYFDQSLEVALPEECDAGDERTTERLQRLGLRPRPRRDGDPEAALVFEGDYPEHRIRTSLGAILEEILDIWGASTLHFRLDGGDWHAFRSGGKRE